MMRILGAVLGGAALFAITAPAMASSEDCAASQKLVDQAISHYQKVGQERAFDDFMQPGHSPWADGDRYIFISAMDGVVKVHPVNPKLINNKSFTAIKDLNGVLFVQEMVNVGNTTPGGGWAKYTWIHPTTRSPAAKQTWVKVHDNMMFMASCFPAN